LKHRHQAAIIILLRDIAKQAFYIAVIVDE